MRTYNKILIGVLYYGESEFADLIKSIATTQSGYEYRVECVPYRDKVSAHKCLYELFCKSDCEVLVKLDSDMTLKRNLNPLIINFFDSKDLHWALDIYDCYTSSSIPAVHFYRKGFKFTFDSIINCDEFGCDRAPNRWLKDEGYVFHGEHENPFQEFRTGVSKGVKVKSGKTTEYSQQYINRNRDNNWLARGVRFGMKSSSEVLNAGNSKLVNEFIKLSIEKYKSS